MRGDASIFEIAPVVYYYYGVILLLLLDRGTSFPTEGWDECAGCVEYGTAMGFNTRKLLGLYRDIIQRKWKLLYYNRGI